MFDLDRKFIRAASVPSSKRSAMSTKSHSLSEAVRIAESVTDESIEDRLIPTLRDSLDDSAKARVLGLYEDGEISEQAARRLLGDDDFEESQLMASGADSLLSGDTSRFVD